MAFLLNVSAVEYHLHIVCGWAIPKKTDGGTAAAVPPPFRLGDLAVCVSH